MRNYIKASVLVVFLLAFGNLQGQSSQSEYLEAKRLFRNGDYASARSAFSSLFEDPSFGAYSGFFAGLASYNEGDIESAISIWKLIPTKYSYWNRLAEVYRWLALGSYELGRFEQALIYSEAFNGLAESSVGRQMALKYLPGASKSRLLSLYEKYPSNAALAKVLVPKLDKNNQEDVDLIGELTAKFDLDMAQLSGVEFSDVKKEAYNVAVLLPYMFTDLIDPTRTISNRVIMDLYQGMLLAEEKLQLEGKEIRLYPFDTKRSNEITASILERAGEENIDLVVGPLFGGPIKAANEFSAEKQINIFNPVSSNIEALGDNPFSYLLKPSHRTMALSLAKCAIDEIENKNALVYYSDNTRDSLFATIYKDEIVANGYEVIEFRPVDNEGSKAILDSLIAQHEEYILSLEELDSMKQIPGRFIKEKEADEEDELEMSLILPYEQEDGTVDSLVFYEMKYNVVEDSIGHIMIASSDNGVVNNFIGAVETRPDTVGLYGYGNWTNFKTVDFNQIERMDLRLADPQYFDEREPLYQQLKDEVALRYQQPISDYHYLGYETIYFLGTMLSEHGKYFQKAFYSAEKPYPGQFMMGFKYGIKNDNQQVPIVTLRNNTLIPVNDNK